MFAKPKGYGRVTTESAVRRIVNKEVRNRLATTRRNRNSSRRNRSSSRRSRRYEPEENDDDDEEEFNSNIEELPREVKDAMREAGLDPNDPDDLQRFIDSMGQQGGKRRRRT